MINGKRGDEQLLSVLIQLIAVVILLILFVYFINSNAAGRLLNDQLTAKQTALLIDNAKPGTTFTLVSKSDISVDTDNKIVISKISAIPYRYEFYSPYTINLEKKEGGVYILTVK